MNVAAAIIHVKMGADVKHYPLDTSVTADQDSKVTYISYPLKKDLHTKLIPF